MIGGDEVAKTATNLSSKVYPVEGSKLGHEGLTDS